ncbi:MAG: hypothetical protein AAGJ91_07645 [Pseudomonadota bacterium]
MSDTEHPPHNIEIPHGPRHGDHTQAAQGYWKAFARRLRYPLGPEDKATAFSERVLDRDHAISAVAPDGTFLGVAGFKSPMAPSSEAGFGISWRSKDGSSRAGGALS